MAADENFLYKELSYQLVGCFYDVYNELGPAHKEQIYHEALKILFDGKGLKFRSKPRIPIQFRDKAIGTYEPDFLIEQEIIVEIKSLLSMPKVFEKQLYYYIKGTQYKVGYLVNFGNEEIEIKRRVYDTARK